MFANNNISQIRSSGITDSRYGYVVTSIWLGKHRFKRSPYLREPLPLPVGVNCYTVAATTLGEYSESNPVRDALISDGLVPVLSTLGLHDEARHVLAFEQ